MISTSSRAYHRPINGVGLAEAVSRLVWRDQAGTGIGR
jgi:hypothetical protein